MAQIFDGRYALPAEPLIEGAHSKLYRAVDLESDNRAVALKVFRPTRVLDDRVLRAAWSNELAAYQSLGNEDSLVQLLGWGRSDDGEPYLAFEWLDADLFTRLDTLQIGGWDDFWPIARDILTGLSLIHSSGFVHRDIKPENILVSEGANYKVADFGTTRLAERANLGMTMAELGTVPYAPPERGTFDPTPAYDIYSFAVLTTVCLTRQVPSDHSDAERAFRAIDLPPEIAEAFAGTLDTDPKKRPESASVLLATLTEIQDKREERRQPRIEVFVDIPQRALDAYAAQYGLSSASATAASVLEDVSTVRAFAFDRRPGMSGLQIAGQTCVLRVERHNRRPGVLYVQRISRPPPQVLEYARTNWYRPQVVLRTSVPIDSPRASEELTNIIDEMTLCDAQRAEAEIRDKESKIFASWKALIRAKFALESERGAPVTYQRFRADGSRVRFKLSSTTPLEIGESRVVKIGNRRVFYGEVEGVENDEIVLYTTRGTASSLPHQGTLEFDAEASKSKLRRERAALDKIITRRAVREDLRELLLSPNESRHPTHREVEEFKQSDLDPAKQKAVSASLGANDFVLVEGPPGTGKTTFIAELVSQQLRFKPDARILVASQTHIALDNALMRIRELDPELDLLRLGRSEVLAEDVEPLGHAAQMETWKKQATAQSRGFIREFAKRSGINVESGDAQALVGEFARRREKSADLRSRISLRQAERRALLEKIQKANALVGPLLDAADRLERAGAGGVGNELMDSIQRFVEAGLEAAAQIETGGALGDKLVAIESSLADWQQELKDQAAQAKTARLALASALSAPDGASDEDLITLAAKRDAVKDQRLAVLEGLASDWEERFGSGPEFSGALVARAQVVAATCVGLTGVPGADAIPFDLCIIDEASKATVTETLVPLANSRRWILVGDDRQLRPFVEHALASPQMLERHELTPADVHQTLFSILAERLPEECRFTLTHQHRMHPIIGQLVSDCFYGGSLTSEPRELSETVKMALGAAAVWVDTSKRSDRHERGVGTSFKNRGEARVIAHLLDRLQWVAERNNENISVAVLTGYDAQRKEVLETLARNELQRTSLRVRVATIDAYQGQEADVCVFSVTRSNEQGDFGFLSSVERINVALSRARDGLAIIGDARFIDRGNSASTPLHAVLKYLRSNPECAIDSAEQS